VLPGWLAGLVSKPLADLLDLLTVELAWVAGLVAELVFGQQQLREL